MNDTIMKCILTLLVTVNTKNGVRTMYILCFNYTVTMFNWNCGSLPGKELPINDSANEFVNDLGISNVALLLTVLMASISYAVISPDR